MKLILLLSLLTLAPGIARASETCSHTFLGYIDESGAQPMLTLLKAIERHPKCNVFILNFQYMNASSINKVRVRYIKNAQKIYLFNEELGRRRLNLYHRVSLVKIKQVSHLKSAIHVNSFGNFDLLAEVGCPPKRLYSHTLK